tara:strand:+ start:687 stop:1478 length:792 start_codon:yes stop_codon:yes gene_type:complete
MPIAGIAQGLGLGGAATATISGAPGGGGCPPYLNTLSGAFNNDRLTMSQIDITGSKACSLWVRASSQMMGGTGAILIGNINGSRYIMYIYSGRYMQSYDNAGYTPTIDFGAGAFTLNTWAHICISSDGTTSTYYLNGVAKDTTANKEFVAVANIGQPGTYNHNNNLDSIALWDSELTSGQVTNIYKGEESGGSGGTNGTPGDLCSFAPLHWWQFGNGPGDVNASGGTPADGGAIGTLVDQGSGGKNATESSASFQPAFSNILP